MMAVSKIKELLGLMQKNLECSICLELMKNPVATKCEHFFCRFCITEFLETKRSVPCPLCKQPITKRGLTEKAELGCIVDGVDNLISAFQEDSGTVYSPPKGPQSFFPCTPETISTKPDNQKTKGRKNVRNSRRQSNVALEEETSDSTRRDTDDIFAIPSSSCQPPRSSRRRRSTAETVTTASDGTPELKSDASTSKKDKSRSPATTTTDDDNGLLQYLDEGSCGFEREKSEQGTFPVDQNTDVIEPPEKSPCKKARSNQESRDQPDIVIFDENEDDVAESNSRLERNDIQDVSNLNEKNLRSRPLNDIENVIEAGNARPRQKGKDEEPSSGAPDNFQNSSNASISSTQQLLQPPVVTKTYGRRSGNKKDSDAKVQDWITALPQNHTSKKNTDVLNQKSKQRHCENGTGKVLEVESDRVEKKNSSAEVLTATIDAHAFCGDDDEDVMEVEDPAQESKKGHTAYLSLQEPEEEIMLTPPIRKKRIFTAEKDSHPRPSRSPLHGKPSILFKSPASTASPAPITSSATRNSPRSSKILSTQTEHTEGNLRKTAEARSNQKYLNSRPCKEVTQHKMAGEDSGHTSLKQAKSKREGEEDAVVCAGNKSELAEAEDNVSVSKRASRGDNYSKVKDVTASEVKSRGTDADLMKTNVVVKGHSDPEADSFSSSTDDLEIMPSENEFEEPDLSLQPEEIQQRISAASSTEDSLFQSSSGNRDKAESIKQSPSTRYNALRNNTRARDSPQASKGADGSKKTKMSTGEEQSELEPRHQPSQTEGKTVSPLDSALTHVPESMDVETAGSVTQTPLTNFSTKNSASQISDNDTSPKEGTSSKSTHDQTDCVEKQASNLNKVRQERAPKEKDAVSQDSAALVGKSPRCSTKQKLANQLSSDTGTPSQSILKPISVVAKSVPPSNIHYSDTEKEEDQEPFVAEEDAEVNYKEMELAHKKARSQSHLNPLQIQVADENQTLKEDHTLPEDQTLTEGQTLAESQTLEASVDSSASPQQNSPAEMSKLTKAYEENENNSSDSNQEHSEEDELKKSEPLVVETQYPSTLEEQSVSLLSPKVIADSIPVNREEEQSPDRSGKDVHVGTESQETITHVDRSRSFQRSMQKSDSSGTTDLQAHSLIPGFSHPELEQPCPQSGEEVSTFVQGKGTKRLQKEEERSSSPATFSITRKRNSHGQESSIKAKLGKDPASHFHTPDLLPLQSPSSSSDKVVNSAPPRTTTIPLDSDDDGAVLIVRRTKRKCFSLDGSPLRPEAPLSTKRRRYGTRQKNLADKFDDLAGNGLCKAKDYEEGGENKVEENIQPAQQEGQESRQNLAAEKNRPMHEESLMSPSSEAENPEEGVKGNTAEGDRKTDSGPKMPAPSRRRKAVRGLARLNDSTSAEFLPNTRQTRTETASGQPLTSGQTDTNSAEGRHSMTSTTQNSPRILVTLTEAHAEDPMEVEEIDGEMVDLEDEDARANSLSHGDKKVSTEHSEPNETREQCFEAPQAAATKATEGADGNPIVVDQMSVRSQTQKSVNQSSIPPSAEDATIPPSDFDLRFDDEDDDSNHDVEDDDSNNDDDEENEGTITEQEPLVLKVNISQSKEPEHGDQGSTMDVDPSPSEDKGKDIDTPAEGASDQTSIVPGHAGPKPQTSETTVREARQSPAEARNKRQGSADALQDSEEEEEEVVVVKKKGRRAVIDSDSDSDHNSGAESEASFQLNFTSSSALSSQSEVPTTQERSKMESELDRLRREIAEMEAKLQGRSSSSKSESAGDSCDMNSSVHRRKGGGKSRLTVEDSSDDEVEELSDSPVRSSRKKPKSAGKEQKDSQTKRSRRRRRISSDEEEEEEKKLKVKQRRQQLMDAFVCEVNDAAVDGDDDGVDGRSSAGQGKVHQFSLHTPDKKVKGRADPEVSDEDSSDLFLSPLSPSPPPPTKHSLARKDSYGPPRSLFSVDSPSLSSSVTRIRPSLDFERRVPLPSEKTPVTSDAEWTKYDDIQDSQESEAEVSGSLKNIPESQFSASGGDSAKKKSKKVKYSGEARAAALVSESKQNCGTSVVEPCAVDSSATPLPSLCNAEGDEENKENMDVDENCDRMEDEENDDAVPRWKRKRLGFISSGLDPEKSSVLRKLAEMNECKVYSKFNDSVTHVIMRTNPDSRVCERTLKYFQGIAGQCWVLSFDWVLHSMKAGHFVPEKHYEIHGDTIKGENHCGPSLSRMSTSPLLQGFALASVGASPDMSKKELTQLLTLMGAEVVEDPWDLASHPAKHKLVLRCVDSDTQPPTPAEIELFNGQYKHFGLVTVAREWILDSICTNHLLPLHDYIFNTCKDLRLPF